MIKKRYSFEKNGVINDVYTLRNAKGAEVDILTYGARIIRVSVPDRRGKLADVVVGCKKPEDYYEENPYFGATVGPFCNRIGGAKFTLNGEEYTLQANEGNNSLHGGGADFSRVVWNANIEKDCLVLTHTSPDGEGGYPGNLSVTLTITFSDDGELKLDYEATTDKDTLCNLTNHTYFNLGVQPTVLHQNLMINAKQITPVDEELIPHGEVMDIEDTPYCFIRYKQIGQDISSDAPLIKQCGGYDFNYCLDRVGKGLERSACVFDPETGRRMSVYTTLPCIQLYTANKTGGFVGKKEYVTHCAVCLETQGYPNSPNCPQYPSSVLKAGEVYHEITSYKFSTRP